jgi:hypothetical protein
MRQLSARRAVRVGRGSATEESIFKLREHDRSGQFQHFLTNSKELAITACYFTVAQYCTCVHISPSIHPVPFNTVHHAVSPPLEHRKFGAELSTNTTNESR